MKKEKIIELVLLLGVVLVYGWVYYSYLSMLPNASDPLQYVEPSVKKSLVGIFPWIDRLTIANGIRLLSLFLKPEIAGAVYFGAVNFLILIIAIIWSYLKRGFWTAFLTGFFLITSYPLLRYANYGYPDATVALFALLALIFYLEEGKRSAVCVGVFTGLALFSKISALAIFIFFLIDILRSKQKNQLKYYLAGIFCVSTMILLITYLLFDYDSIRYVFSGVIYNITSNTEPRPIAASILTIFSPEILLPGSLALIIFSRAYKDRETRKIFLLSVTFIIFFFLMVALSSHIKIFPHYLYTSYVLGVIVMSWFLASLWDKKIQQKKRLLFYLFALGIICLLCLGFYAGAVKATELVAITKASIYLKLFYGLFALVVTGLMILISIYRSTQFITAFIIVIAFLGSFYTFGSVYRIVSRHRVEINTIYHFAESMRDVSENPVNIYSSSLDDHFERRISWVNRLFYSRNLKEINVISNSDINSDDWSYLLTDDLKAIPPEKFEIINQTGKTSQVYLIKLK